MQYRKLGKTDVVVSALGLGAMRLPTKGGPADVDEPASIEMIRYAVDHGVNYIDTAVGYCGGDSQRVLSEALKGRRDQVILSTKNHYYGEDEKEWWNGFIQKPVVF